MNAATWPSVQPCQNHLLNFKAFGHSASIEPFLIEIIAHLSAHLGIFSRHWPLLPVYRSTLKHFPMFTGASTYSEVAASQCFSPNASAHLGKVQQVTNFFSLGLQIVMLWYSPVDVFAWGLSTASVSTRGGISTAVSTHLAYCGALLAYLVGSICITNLQHIDSDNFESYSDTFCPYSLHAMADRANYLFDMLSAEDKWIATTTQYGLI